MREYSIRNFILFSCLFYSVFRFIEYLTNVLFIATGDILFLFTPLNLMALAQVLLPLLMVIFLIKNNLSGFYVCFGILTCLDFLTKAIIMSFSLDLTILFEIDIKIALYYIFENYILTIVLGIYAILFVVCLVLYFKRHFNLTRFTMITMYVGVAITICNVISAILSYAQITEGFSFFDCFFDLLCAFAFSLIYIFTPRYMEDIL